MTSMFIKRILFFAYNSIHSYIVSATRYYLPLGPTPTIIL